MKQYKIRIYGGVQGVCYRASALDAADEFGCKGFIRNEADGSVYIEAEAPESQLQQLVEWCKQGPPAANVEKVEFEEHEPVGFYNFTIQRRK